MWIDPVIVSIGPFAIRWYGMMYILGFVIAYFMIKLEVKRKRINFTTQDINDFILCLAFGLIIGARIGYVVFYNLSYYIKVPLKIFFVWEGGMSFHGGLIGAIIVGFLFLKKRKIRFYDLADIVIVPVPIGLFLGRIGNFINGELYGRPTTVPWGLVFPHGGPMPRHPSQLYEALFEGCILFVLLWYLSRREWPKGFIFWSFFIFYGIFRFNVEFFREPDSHLGFVLGFLTRGQILCIPMVILGIFMTYWLAKRQKE